MTTADFTVSIWGVRSGDYHSYVITSGSHTYQSGTQSGVYATFSGATSYDIGSNYEAYDLPLSMTLTGTLGFVSADDDVIVQDGGLTLTFTSTSKYILGAQVTTGANDEVTSVTDNAASTLTVTLPVNTQFRNVTLQVTFANYATLSDFTSLGNNTYAISSKEDLAKLAGIVNVQKNNCYGLTFRQTETITCDNTYSPIGGFQTDFQGTYDGQGYTISGITVNQFNRNIGLFGSIRDGTIMNVVLRQCNFSGQHYVGGIVGICYSGIVQNCRVLGVTINDSQDDSNYLGAIVGSCFSVYSLLLNNYYRGCTVCGETTQVGIGGSGNSSDCEDARSIHMVTPYNVSISGGETVMVDNQTYYAAGVPITVSYSGSVSDGQIPQFFYNDGSDHPFSVGTFAMPAADITLSATIISAQSQITARPADGRYWTTFYDGLWRYQLPEDATAYTMSYDRHLYRLGDDGHTIPAGTAVVIISDRADIALTRTNDVSPVDIYGGTNTLLGSDNPVTLTGGRLGGKEVYVMGVDNDHLGFYTYTGSAIPAGKAYYKEEQIVDLASITTSYTAQDGDILTGKRRGGDGLQIADNATVTLYDVDYHTKYAIACLGNATIILVGTNTVSATDTGYAGIRCGGSGTTLTIRGTGSLTVQGKGREEEVGGAGIGSDAFSLSCGDIRVEGGTITATGGRGAAGIGCGFRVDRDSKCGSIYISGGTITAYGGYGAAGIGCGYATTSGNLNKASSICGDITITSSVNCITASKGPFAPYSIGKGYHGGQHCGTITIGGVDYGTNGIATSPFTYTPQN
jgi:hypothetical protein